MSKNKKIEKPIELSEKELEASSGGTVFTKKNKFGTIDYLTVGKDGIARLGHKDLGSALFDNSERIHEKHMKYWKDDGWKRMK